MTWREKARTWVQRLDRALASGEQRRAALSDGQSSLDKNPLGLPTADQAANPGAGQSRLAAPKPVSAQGDGSQVVEAPNKDGSTSIYGVPGTLITGGFLVPMGEFNPLLMGRQAVDTWEKMRRTDSQVDKTLEMCFAPMLGAKWDVLPDPNADGKDSLKKEIADAARENLFSGMEYSLNGVTHTQTWNESLRNILLMLPMGCSAYEEVFAVDGGAVRLACLADLPPKTFYQWDVEPDGRTLRALIQLGYRGQLFERLEVPADRLCTYTFRQEGADFWGRSILRAAYSHWYAKNLLYRVRNIGAERTSIGVPCITLGPNATAEDRQLAIAYVTQLAAHEKTGLVLPNGATFKIHGVEGQVFNSMEDVVHHNEQISFVALDFFSNLGRGGRGAGGNRALASGQGKFFMLALQNTADFVAQRFSTVTLRRWTAFNYGPDAPVPMMTVANVQARDFSEVMQILTQAAGNGLVKSDRGIRGEIRNKAGMPEETDVDVIAAKGETVTEGLETGAVAGKGAGDVDAGGQGGQEAPQEGKGAGSGELGAGKKKTAQASEMMLAEPARKTSRLKRPRDQQSPHWHEPVAAHEVHTNFRKIADTLDASGAQLSGALKKAAPKVIRAVAHQAFEQKRMGRESSEFSFRHLHDVEAKIVPVIRAAYQQHRAEMAAELGRAGAGSREFGVGRPVLGAELASTNDPPTLIAHGLVQDLINRYGVSAAGAAQDLTPEDDEDMIVEALHKLSPGFLDRLGDEASRDAMRYGRADGAEDAGIPEDAVWRRTALLDEKTCAPCADADGQALDGPDEDLSDICEGGEACRCFAVADLS